MGTEERLMRSGAITLLSGAVTIRRLETKPPPLDALGGRILSPSGEIAQIVSGATFRYLAYLEFLPDPAAARGHHGHRLQEEYLYVIRGDLLAIYEDAATGERAETFLGAGDLINVRPGCAHAYVAQAYSQLLEFSPTPFDYSDTYRYPLVGAPPPATSTTG